LKDEVRFPRRRNGVAIIEALAFTQRKLTMKGWTWFVVTTVICWGAYVPVLHHGQTALGPRSQLRAFLFVGGAYFLTSALVLAIMMLGKLEPLEFNSRGAWMSTFAGILGAVGAVGVVFALKYGKPIYVAPLVFAGAPVVNTIVSMIWTKPERPPHVLFYAGIALAAAGAGLVLRFRPT
jgi:hypothetical protein